ncbi:nitrogen regulatory protein P-II homolog [Rhododendron vialii]|uniref:nitrogen regulatory protein P-II homolog n=1 Tax=Rhododendron vialii TaxID=182163 RepID=UPI00265F45C1|nr:nitrogen regulatory protein P-II homolog [Rhododendron vialii]
MASSYSSILKPGGGTLNRLYSQLKGFQLVGGSTSIPPSTCPKLRQYSQSLSLLNLTLKPTRNASLLPIIKAQGSPDYFPDANFYKVEAILRPWRIPQVSSALLKMGIRGVTVSDVRGFGAQGGLTERQAGSEFSEDKFLAKVKLEIVVSKEQVEAVIDKIIEVTRTGEIGDGKIFLVPVSDVIRVRTGERGEKAERMAGGRADMSSPVQN